MPPSPTGRARRRPPPPPTSLPSPQSAALHQPACEMPSWLEGSWPFRRPAHDASAAGTGTAPSTLEPDSGRSQTEHTRRRQAWAEDGARPPALQADERSRGKARGQAFEKIKARTAGIKEAIANEHLRPAGLGRRAGPPDEEPSTTSWRRPCGGSHRATGGQRETDAHRVEGREELRRPGGSEKIKDMEGRGGVSRQAIHSRRTGAGGEAIAASMRKLARPMVGPAVSADNGAGKKNGHHGKLRAGPS